LTVRLSGFLREICGQSVYLGGTSTMENINILTCSKEIYDQHLPTLKSLLGEIQGAAVKVHLLSLCTNSEDHNRKIFTTAVAEFYSLTKKLNGLGF
jgi:hypothetical protein